ncbi:MAG: hydantoinase/oxoprolinase family protein [Chloroflexi bacterium]|nr:hydantoinase/oxoprolinase family protein [Chloroflexota bacterium]
MSTKRFRIGVDIGGTFTDGTLVDTDTGDITTSKVLTTPDDPSLGFISAIRRLLSPGSSGTPPDSPDARGARPVSPELVDHVVHATTVATNAIIERKTAPTAFVTTKGFRDMLEIARQIRPSLYDLQFEKPPPLVPRRLCFEVPERLGAKGEVITALDEEATRQVARAIAATGIESVAVCLLHSYRNPAHEQAVGKILAEEIPGVSVSLSSAVVPEFREYFRASTTVINAGVRPIVGRYLTTIEKRLDADGFDCDLLVMQSNGGVYSSAAAIEKPVFMVESGPAAGSVAAAAIGTALGYPDVISFDMGGTTAKASLIRDGRPSVTKDYTVGAAAQSGAGAFGGASGYPVRTPVVDLVEVGAGGGSIGWVDSGGALRVGPHSAGASPGPACYGNGGEEPTITDANLVLGRLDPMYFAGGEIPLDRERAARAIDQHCAQKLGLSVEETAHGIIEIATTAMVNALRLVSVQRGHDPRDFMLVAFGGAGPAHAVRIAEEVGVSRALIPLEPGTASAMGLLSTDIRMESTTTVISRADSLNPGELQDAFSSMESKGAATLREAASAHTGTRFERAIEMRYYGQSFELTVDAPEGEADATWMSAILEKFHASHERAYGFRVDAEPVEVVNLRSTAVGEIRKPGLKPLANVGGDLNAALKSRRPVYFNPQTGFVETPVFDRVRLPAGAKFNGPAIVEEKDSTTVVLPGWRAQVDPYGNLLITR